MSVHMYLMSLPIWCVNQPPSSPHHHYRFHVLQDRLNWLTVRLTWPLCVLYLVPSPIRLGTHTSHFSNHTSHNPKTIYNTTPSPSLSTTIRCSTVSSLVCFSQSRNIPLIYHHQSIHHEIWKRMQNKNHYICCALTPPHHSLPQLCVWLLCLKQNCVWIVCFRV